MILISTGQRQPNNVLIDVILKFIQNSESFYGDFAFKNIF